MSQVKVTFKGNPVTLEGQPPKVGDKAPDFQAVDTGLQGRSLKDFAGKVKLITAVPSLDTAVCDKETRTFNEKADSLGDDVVVLTLSMDLPFAQKRWCGAAGVERVQCLSDYKERSFGQAWGLRIKELGLLARSVFVIDKDDTIRYAEVVPEIAEEPNYDAALDAAKKLL